MRRVTQGLLGMLGMLALSSLFTACGGKKGTLTVTLLTPLDVDPFAAAAKVHIVVGNPAISEQTVEVSAGHFTADLAFKPPSSGALVGPVVVEALGSDGTVLSRGRSPDLAFVPIDESITVWVAPVGRAAVFPGSLKSPRIGAMAARLPGLGALYVGGAASPGDAGSADSITAEAFNAYTLATVAVQSIPSARAGGIAIAVDKQSGVGNVLLAGGGLDPSLLSFDASGAAGSWSPVNTDASLSRNLAASTTLSDGTTLIVGGQGANRDPLATATVIATAASIAVTPVVGKLASPRVGHTVTASRVPGGEGAVIVGGGAGVELYTSAARTFMPSPIDAGPGQPVMPFSGHTATALASGKVLVLGGNDFAGVRATANGVLVDAVAGTAQVISDLLSSARTGHTATLLGTTLLVCGGEDDSHVAIAGCDLIDVSGDAPKRTKSIPLAAPRTQHSAVVLPQGTVLIAGGRDSAAQTSLEMFTP